MKSTATGTVRFPGAFDTGTATVAIDTDHVATTLDPKQADGSTRLGSFTVQRARCDHSAQDPLSGRYRSIRRVRTETTATRLGSGRNELDHP